MSNDITPQAAADLRQALGEALAMKLADLCEDGQAPDWFDAVHVDEVLDVLMPLIAAVPSAAPCAQATAPRAPRAFRTPEPGTPWWQTAKDCGAWTDRQEGDVGYVHFGSVEALRVYTVKISNQARAAASPQAAVQTEQGPAVPFISAPHPQLQNALFCYATGDDGASAELIHGWPALVARVASEVAGDGWEEALADLDEWSDDGWGVPYRYSTNFEDGYMAIYRISEPAAGGL